MSDQNRAIDWTHLFEKHPSEWVALQEDEETVISHAGRAKEALQQA